MTAPKPYVPPDLTEPRHNRRRGPWRRLTLLDRGDRPFLVRRGIDVRLFGIYVHDVAAPDPGLDMHDHPWAFVSWVIRGGYTELHAESRCPEASAVRRWSRWSIHRMRQTDIHRITATEPGTVTLVLRGRKTRRWGFYLPGGAWIDWAAYDYETRRPGTEVRAS